MLPLATAHIACLCKQFDQVCTTNFYARFKTIIFYQNSPKIKLFLKKKCKIFKRWVLCPQTPPHSPPLRISGYAPGNFVPFIIICVFVAFVFSNFFYRSVANLIMFSIDVCLMLDCFLFEKFYLYYALCGFDFILRQCTKIFIRQSIDCEQIFDVTLNPPIEKSCVRHCLPAYF